jgi:hypothetical protein
VKLNSRAMRFLERRGLPSGSNVQQVRRFVTTLSHALQSQLVRRDSNALALIRGADQSNYIGQDIDDEESAEATSETPVASGRGQRGAGRQTTDAHRTQTAGPVSGSAQTSATAPASGITTPAPLPSDAELTRARTEERQRIQSIRSLATSEIPEELVQRACDDGWTADESGRRFYEHIRRQSAAAATNFDTRQNGQAPGVHARRGATIESLQGALVLRQGIALDSQRFRGEGGQAMLRGQSPWLTRAARSLDANETIPGEVAATMEDAHRYRNRSLVDICRLMLRASGRNVPSDNETVVERAFTSSDLRTVFGPVIIAQILAGYEEYPDSTRGWVQEAEWNDFRENNVIQIDAANKLKKHTRNKEAPPVELIEAVEKYKVERFVGMFQLDDQDIVNDMLGATPEIPMQLGQLAREIRPDLVCAMLLLNPNLADGSALFNTGSPRTNALTGSALAQATVQSLEALMAKQSIADSTGAVKALNLTAGYLYVPRSLRLLAKRLVGSEMITSAEGDLNALRGEFSFSSDARLDLGVTNPLTGAFVAGAPTQWYMAASGGKYGFQIGYRRGTGKAPKVMTKPLNKPGCWGIGWDVAMDIGIGITNFRGLARAVA